MNAACGQVAVDGARVGDREIGTPERLQAARRVLIFTWQPAGVANVRAHRQVGHASQPVRPRALVAGTEVVQP